MVFVTVEDGKIKETGPRPRWFTDDKRPVSDEYLKSVGRLPLVNVIPNHDARSQQVIPPSKDEWVIEEGRVLAYHTIRNIPLEELKDKLHTANTQKRWSVMTGGVTLPSGVRVGTTIDDQNRIAGIAANAQHAGLKDTDEVDFKAMDGWVRVTIKNIKAMAGAVGRHIQSCYSAERQHYEAIEALTEREDAIAYDLTKGWP